MTLFNILAGIATFIGLGFSVLAWTEAKKAAEAARQARAAVLIRTLADALNDSAALIDKIILSARLGHFEEITDTAYQVNGLLSEMTFRMKERLDEPSVNELLTARTQFQIICEMLLPGRPAFTDEDKQQLVRVSQHTSARIREMIGAIKGRLDRGEFV